jgi:hypothetical protein
MLAVERCKETGKCHHDPDNPPELLHHFQTKTIQLGVERFELPVEFSIQISQLLGNLDQSAALLFHAHLKLCQPLAIKFHRIRLPKRLEIEYTVVGQEVALPGDIKSGAD